jgi:hypothetical protein
MRAWPTTLAVLLAGCAATAPAATKAPEALVVNAARAEPHADEPETPTQACESATVDVEVPPQPLHCEDGRLAHCSLEAPVTVRNCGSAPISITGIEIDSEKIRWLLEFEDGTLQPNATVSPTLRGFNVGRQQLVVRYRDGAGRERSIARTVTVDHPEREARLAACRACNGDWGVHGLSGVESCNCETRDAGQECRDGRECEGECLYERAEEVQKASQRCSGGTCSVTLRAVRLVGRCAPQRATFGCHSYVPDGESERAPRIGAVRVPHICVD